MAILVWQLESQNKSQDLSTPQHCSGLKQGWQIW